VNIIRRASGTNQCFQAPTIVTS